MWSSGVGVWGVTSAAHVAEETTSKWAGLMLWYAPGVGTGLWRLKPGYTPGFEGGLSASTPRKLERALGSAELAGACAAFWGLSKPSKRSSEGNREAPDVDD